MAEAKHTPRPWRTSRSDMSMTDVRDANGDSCGRLAVSIFSGESTRPMIRVGAKSDDPSEVWANACLIAAAPDLLEALTRCLNFIANTESEMGETLPSGEMARAAIAKASGEAL